MERLSEDLNLALEQSNCDRPARCRLGFRRRTRSTGNLPAAVAVSTQEECSSGSPPLAPLVTQPLSDSDETQTPHNKHNLTLRYCAVGNFESDSFNENFSPSRPAIAKRKRKFKKLPVDDLDGTLSPTVETAHPAENHGRLLTPAVPHKTIKLKERHTCGKRKWSQREKGDVSEMRERSLSGGCSSKASVMSTFKSKVKKILQPGKINFDQQHKGTSYAPNLSLPGSSKFNFVYKANSTNGPPQLANHTVSKCRVSTKLSPFTNQSSSGRGGIHGRATRRLPSGGSNPLHPEGCASGAECPGHDSSSISSSETEGIESDHEGDDELTDWPGIEDLKSFNKSLTFRSSTPKRTAPNNPPLKKMRKDKNVDYSFGWGSGSFKNKNQRKRIKFDSCNEDDEADCDTLTHVNLSIIDGGEPSTSCCEPPNVLNRKLVTSVTNALDLTLCSSIVNRSNDESKDGSLGRTAKCERSTLVLGNINTARVIRAGRRVVGVERPSYVIQSAMNEQLSRFLQDPAQDQLHLHTITDPKEIQKLESFAKMYSLEITDVLGYPLMRKTSHTTQSICVENCSPFGESSEFKRRCYGEENATTQWVQETVSKPWLNASASDLPKPSTAREAPSPS